MIAFCLSSEQIKLIQFKTFSPSAWLFFSPSMFSLCIIRSMCRFLTKEMLFLIYYWPNVILGCACLHLITANNSWECCPRSSKEKQKVIGWISNTRYVTPPQVLQLNLSVKMNYCVTGQRIAEEHKRRDTHTHYPTHVQTHKSILLISTSLMIHSHDYPSLASSSELRASVWHKQQKPWREEEEQKEKNMATALLDLLLRAK